MICYVMTVLSCLESLDESNFLTKFCLLLFFSPECKHPDQDYAWNSIQDVIPLGTFDFGLLLRDQKNHLICLDRIDDVELIAYPASESSHVCRQLLQEIEKLNLFKGEERIRFIIPIDKTLYYANESEYIYFAFCSLSLIVQRYCRKVATRSEG